MIMYSMFLIPLRWKSNGIFPSTVYVIGCVYQVRGGPLKPGTLKIMISYNR